MREFEQFFETGEIRKYLEPRGACKDCDAVHDALDANDIDALKQNPDAYAHAMQAYECYREGVGPSTEISDAVDPDLHKQQVAEAQKRLRMLGCVDCVAQDFAKSGKLYYSERTPLGGILYWMDNKPEWATIVRQFEEEYNAVVYHATHEYTEFGELLDLLFVSNFPEDWEDEKESLKDLRSGEAYVYAYVVNLTDPDYPEMGSIGITRKSGGIIRTA